MEDLSPCNFNYIIYCHYIANHKNFNIATGQLKFKNHLACFDGSKQAREIENAQEKFENNAYENFWRDNKKYHHGIFEKGLFLPLKQFEFKLP